MSKLKLIDVAGVVPIHALAIASVLLFIFTLTINANEVSAINAFSPDTSATLKHYPISNQVPTSLATLTSFEISTETVEMQVPFTTEIQYSDEIYLGDQRVVQAGEYGTIVETYELKTWQGQEYDRNLIDRQTTDPVVQIIQKGTKKHYQQLDTEIGSLTYYLSYSMYATSYDGNCYGCSGTTYMGTSVDYGVCAVDPNVIPLGSKIYVEGYGRCTALDIGGAIKGNRIDVGFADVRQGWWSSRYTNVYLLSD